MNDLSKIKDILDCNINDLISNSDNQLLMANNIIRKLDREIVSGRSKVKSASAREKRERTAIEGKQDDFDLWQKRYAAAIDKNDNLAAKQALVRKNGITQDLNKLENLWWETSLQLKSLLDNLHKLEDTIQVARRHKDLLVVKTRQGTSSSDFIPIPLSESQIAGSTKQAKETEIEAELQKLKNIRKY